MPEHAQFTDLMGLACLVFALTVACLANTGKIPRLGGEARELLAGGSVLLAILGTVFVLSE
ncbi:hypothetical protein [Methylobacterium nigriterrae]|uniref:hypothetical protein n=1 Tax=Methylobacterium nigriterrae TaxID=3127512 RepID=UPI0030135007